MMMNNALVIMLLAALVVFFGCKDGHVATNMAIDSSQSAMAEPKFNCPSSKHRFSLPMSSQGSADAYSVYAVGAEKSPCVYLYISMLHDYILIKYDVNKGQNEILFHASGDEVIKHDMERTLKKYITSHGLVELKEIGNPLGFLDPWVTFKNEGYTSIVTETKGGGPFGMEGHRQAPYKVFVGTTTMLFKGTPVLTSPSAGSLARLYFAPGHRWVIYFYPSPPGSNVEMYWVDLSGLLKGRKA